MASLNLKNIYKVYPNGTKAVNDFTMDINDKEFIVFVGPSGCGKSTVLRMIAGLEEISAGELKIDGAVVNDVDCKMRDTAMVFQNYALYPHMTVAENMAFPLKMNKLTKAEKAELRAETDRRYPPKVFKSQCKKAAKKQYLAEIAAQNGSGFKMTEADRLKIKEISEQKYGEAALTKEQRARLKAEIKANKPPEVVLTAEDKKHIRKEIKNEYPRSLLNLLLYPLHWYLVRRNVISDKRGGYEKKRLPSLINNILRPFREAAVKRENMLAKVEETAKILGLEEYLGKRPGAMSGGQRQRVALGRAMVRHPKVFLLDEPLSNLDAKLRTQMRSEITKLHNRLQTTFIYVTHDQTEAMTMGDRIVVMKLGRIQQIDTPLNLYAYPENVFVAGFIGTPAMNFFDATVDIDGEKAEITFANGKKLAFASEHLNKLERKYLGKTITFGVRPEDFRIADEGAECRITGSEMLGSETLLYCDFDTDNTTDYENSAYSFIVKVEGICRHGKGEIINVDVNFAKAHYFDKDSGESVMKRFVAYNDVDAFVKDGKLDLGGQSVALPPALSMLADGGYRVVFPSDAVEVGGDYAAEVCSCEKLKEGWLARLKTGGVYFYALTGEEVRGNIKIGIRWNRVDFNVGETTVKPALSTANSFGATLEKRSLKKRERNGLPEEEARNFDVDVKCGGRSLACPYPVLKRLMGASDRKLYGIPMRLSFDESAVTAGNRFNAEVKEIYGYGGCRYARCVCMGKEIVIPYTGGGKSVDFDIDLTKASIYDDKLGIKIT